jgi:hypothetical protein
VIKRIRARLKTKASYSFYVWENGGYVHVEGGCHESNDDAASAAIELIGGSVSLQRPASLDAPHLHVVREDGVHILTLELPEQPGQSVAA